MHPLLEGFFNTFMACFVSHSEEKHAQAALSAVLTVCPMCLPCALHASSLLLLLLQLLLLLLLLLLGVPPNFCMQQHREGS